MNVLYCGYEDCNPTPALFGELVSMQETWDLLAGRDFLEADPTTGIGDTAPWVDFPTSNMRNNASVWLDESNPAYNLPAKVAYAKTEGDVVHIIKFAKRNNIELSVKNSGHSYKGDSTKKDTLLVVLKEFTKYSVQEGVQICDENGDYDEPDLDGVNSQPCALALDRAKKAVIRVGAGESNGDLFIAVHRYNRKHADPKDKLIAYGGASNTVGLG